MTYYCVEWGVKLYSNQSRAAVRHAAVDRYLLLTTTFTAVAHVGTDRRTDTLPSYKPCFFFTLLPPESKRIDEFQKMVLVPVNSIVFVTFAKHFTLLWAYGGLPPYPPINSALAEKERVMSKVQAGYLSYTVDLDKL